MPTDPKQKHGKVYVEGKLPGDIYCHNTETHLHAPLINEIKSKRFTLIEINWSVLIMIHKLLNW